MLFIVNPEIVLLEVTNGMRVRLAGALLVPPSMVSIQWESRGLGQLVPRVDVELPPMLPPADLDVSDAEALQAWEAQHADIPGVREFLKAKGVEDPDKVIAYHAQLLVSELRKRLAALT